MDFRDDVASANRLQAFDFVNKPLEIYVCAFGFGDLAFALHATTIEQLLQVADAGAVMPPKSTWFEPKLRSGMVVNLLNE